MHVLFGQDKYETPGQSITDSTWEDIVNQCTNRSNIVRHKNDKPKAGWISSAILYNGATSRKETDVERMADFIGLDLDYLNMPLRELLATYLGNVTCIVYSTTNSTYEAPRWRIIIRLSREMTTQEFSGVWKALNLLFDSNVDESTKNANRIHYLPAKWIGGNNELHVQYGMNLNVDELLQCCPPEEPVFQKIVSYTEGLPAPINTTIITEAMHNRYDLTTSGGYFKLMCAAATRYRSQGWILHPNDLAEAAKPYLPKDAKPYREAERAIDYINSRVEPVTPLQKLQNDMKWRLKQRT